MSGMIRQSFALMVVQTFLTRVIPLTLSTVPPLHSYFHWGKHLCWGIGCGIGAGCGFNENKESKLARIESSIAFK